MYEMWTIADEFAELHCQVAPEYRLLGVTHTGGSYFRNRSVNSQYVITSDKNFDILRHEFSNKRILNRAHEVYNERKEFSREQKEDHETFGWLF